MRLSTEGTWPTGDIMTSRNQTESQHFKQAGAALHLEHRSTSVRSSGRNSGWHNLTSADTPLHRPLFSRSPPRVAFNTILTHSIKISRLLSSHFSTFAFLLFLRTPRPFTNGSLSAFAEAGGPAELFLSARPSKKKASVRSLCEETVVVGSSLIFQNTGNLSHFLTSRRL